MNNDDQSQALTPFQKEVMANVRRWRQSHGLEPVPRKGFRNEPKILKLSKRSIVIDIEAEVKVIK